MKTSLPSARSALLAASLASAFFVTALTTPAAPSILVNKGPVLPKYQYTGPTNNTTFLNDDIALAGQWFHRVKVNIGQDFRTNEFYDDPITTYGTQTGTAAIHGVVTAVYRNPTGTHMLGFDLKITVSNDTYARSGFTHYSGNSQGEYRYTYSFSRVQLRDAFIALEFAVPFNYPGGVIGQIVSNQHDALAYYNGGAVKAYVIPSFNLGTIAPGGQYSRTVRLNFGTPGGVPVASDARALVALDSWRYGYDVLSNRSSSLKIRQFPGVFARDTALANNASVFHHY